MDNLKAAGEACDQAVAALRGWVYVFSFDPVGCRAVQLALDVVDRQTAASIIGELHGHVRQALGSPHANYVIQKVIETQPTVIAGFVAEELHGSGVEVACHRYGCRIFCRLLEHSANEAGTAALTDEVLMEAEKLSRHSFGHHVAQSILEHGLPRQQKCIVSALCGDVLRFARNRNSSYVMEKVLTHCAPEDRQLLITGLLADCDTVAALAQNQFGCFVVRALLRLPGEDSRKTFSHLQDATPQLLGFRYGRLMLEEVGFLVRATPGSGAVSWGRAN